jgi:hypothetical protein
MLPRPRIKYSLDNTMRLLVGRETVTIAAGFRFDNGALLCADTKYVGAMALYNPKLFPKAYNSGAASIFAVVGNSAFSRMAVDKCEAALAQLSDPSQSKMAAVIESVLLKVHKQHVFPHPDRNLEGGPDFWLILALFSPIDKVSTYYTTQTALVPFDLYHCSGSGEYLGHYLIKPRYQTPGLLSRAVTVACTALTRIKSYDANCGGNSQFILLDNDGYIGEMRQFNIASTERFSEYFHELSEHLYEEISDVNLTEEEVAKKFSTFKKVALHYRDKHVKEEDAYNSLIESLRKPRLEPGPES